MKKTKQLKIQLYADIAESCRNYIAVGKHTGAARRNIFVMKRRLGKI